MILDVTQKYDKEAFTKFLRAFLPDDFELKEDRLYFDSKFLNSENSLLLGTSDNLDLAVYEFLQISEKDPRVSITKETISLMKRFCPKNNVLAVFHNKDSNHWRFSLITSDVAISARGNSTQEFSNPKRYSFLLGEGCKRHTPESMFFENGSVKKVSDLEDLKSRFSVESVTKEFYSKLFAWYEWARECVKYPFGVDKKVELINYKQDEKLISTHIIRLITRLIFVWFIKQKDLVPKDLFDKDSLARILNNFDDKRFNSIKDGTYYNAILQNLFFATLNNQIGERTFAEKGENYTQHFGIKTLFRDDKKDSYFKISHEEFIELFSKIPYLNGGLFECLDHFDEDVENHNHQIYVDGFSAEDGRKAFVPNVLFFDEERGLIPILKAYNFTVEESTPSDIQVALDPELLGKVFENLLGAYNPETQESARKDSGSFYTPREIVEYMVNESLKSYLMNDGSLNDKTISDLLDGKEDFDFKENEAQKIIDRLLSIKVLDPACGSGAFPMGMLGRLVEIIGVLDKNISPYELKLRLIQNCIYGVDIQPIAVQISKLRFFISLICEQEKTSNSDENYGINILPNLETKIICANSLIGVKRNKEAHGLFHNDEIDKLEKELLEVRNKHIFAKNIKEKFNFRQEDRKLSKRLIELLKKENEFGEANDSAEMLAKWNPYDQNAQSPFFDAEWMFGIKTGNVENKSLLTCNDATGGGFDIVIGNPPYGAKISKLEKRYYKEHYDSTKTENGIKGSCDTFVVFIELGHDLLKINGNLAFIVPMSVTSSDAMGALHKKIKSDCGIIKVSSYAVRPKPVFENAVVDVSIIQMIKDGKANQKLYSTKMYRRTENFNLKYFVDHLQFVRVEDLCLIGRIPKISEEIERRILKKLFYHKRIVDYKDENGKPIYYRTSGGRYFKVVTNYSTKSTKEKAIFFKKEYCNTIGCFLSSNLSFWFYQIISNNHDWKSAEIESFPLPDFSKLQKTKVKELEILYSEYLTDIEKNANMRTSSESSSYNVATFKEYKIVKSKPIIDRIDDLICPLYGLTSEETDFIKNYELDARMSGAE